MQLTKLNSNGRKATGKPSTLVTLTSAALLFLATFAPSATAWGIDLGGGELDFAQLTQTTCFGLPATPGVTTVNGVITGTEGNDVIIGTSRANVIDGKGGNDLLCGAGGDDRIFGGAGDDMISGGPGNDPKLDGQAGNDRIEGGTDNDVLRGGNGIDTMLGGAGIDDLNGEKGADALNGNGGTPDKCDGGLDLDVDVADTGNCELIVNVP